MNTTIQQLKEKWDALKAEQPHIRIRNAAEILGISEAELLITKTGDTVTWLRGEPKAILKEIETLGYVMALTRNNSCVNERKGVYKNAKISSASTGLFVGEDIDLRIFFNHWKFVFAVTEVAGGKEQNSLQFFGKDGMAIHKIYLTPKSDKKAFFHLIEKYKAEQQPHSLQTEEYIPADDIISDGEVDIVSFQKKWLNLKDTHQFFSLIKKHKISRTQALRIAPDKYHAMPIDKNKIVSMLEAAVKLQVPIMAFVGNRGCIQIHTGEIYRTLWHNEWFNVLDPHFNLHLNMNKIAESWIVRKPTKDGIVTSIEVFDVNGETIVQFFGKRKPGIPELPQWQEIVKELETEPNQVNLNL